MYPYIVRRDNRELAQILQIKKIKIKWSLFYNEYKYLLKDRSGADISFLNNQVQVFLGVFPYYQDCREAAHKAMYSLGWKYGRSNEN